MFAKRLARCILAPIISITLACAIYVMLDAGAQAAPAPAGSEAALHTELRAASASVATTQTLFLTSTLPTPLRAPRTVNSLPITTLISISAEVRAHIREIYAYGQTLGNNPQHFSAVGDSSIAGGQFLERFAKGP